VETAASYEARFAPPPYPAVVSNHDPYSDSTCLNLRPISLKIALKTRMDTGATRLPAGICNTIFDKAKRASQHPFCHYLLPVGAPAYASHPVVVACLRSPLHGPTSKLQSHSPTPRNRLHQLSCRTLNPFQDYLHAAERIHGNLSHTQIEQQPWPARLFALAEADLPPRTTGTTGRNQQQHCHRCSGTLRKENFNETQSNVNFSGTLSGRHR